MRGEPVQRVIVEADAQKQTEVSSSRFTVTPKTVPAAEEGVKRSRVE